MTEELQVLERLCIAGGKETAAAPPEKRSRTRKLLTASQLDPEEEEYFDFVGEIVHKGGGGQSAIDLVLCDYTLNDRLKGTLPESYGLPSDLCGRLLACTLWDGHVEAAKGLLPGQIVRLDNLHAKCTADGLFQASLHGDREGHRRVHLVEQGTEMAAVLLRRRDRFLEGRKAMADAGRLSCPTKIIDCEDFVIEDRTVQAVLAAATNDPSFFRIRGRVTGHTPKDVADFTRHICAGCRGTWPTTTESCGKKCPACGKNSNNYAYMFCLLVDDGTGEIPLIACYKDATRLLCGLSPTNLHTDTDACERLGGLMRRLLGTAIPAVFAIRSYRVSADGSDNQRFRITNTVIDEQ